MRSATWSQHSGRSPPNRIGVTSLRGAPSVWLWLKAGRRIGLDRAYALACLIEAIGVALGGLVENGWGAIVSSVLLGGTFMGVPSIDLDREAIKASGTKAVVYGIVLTALVQGVLAGLGYWVAGLQAPVLLGALTGLIALPAGLAAFHAKARR